MKRSLSIESLLILFFVLFKLTIHLFTYDNYELHRDAYLYYAQGQHLAWGYIAVPPFIAKLGKIATDLLGNTTFALRLIPALFGSLQVLIIGLMIRELKGGKMALILASLAFILSPAYLHSNTLFQPVSLNHFFWLLSGYLILMLIKRQDTKIWIPLLVVFALAFLNKYSVLFFALAFVIALLISRYRYLFLSRYFLFGLLLSLVVVYPNLIWQYQHNWPVLHHMAELRRTQLVHVRYSDFFINQFLMNMQALPIWLAGLVGLLFLKPLRPYRLFGFQFIFVVGLLILGRGKAYYTLGLYPILFVFGAILFDLVVTRFRKVIFVNLLLFMCVSLYFSLSFGGIPLNTFENAVRKDAFRWEDGVNHDIPQDMADMTGWTQLAEKVIGVFLSLDEKSQKNCDIYCYHYGQAGAVMFHGKDLGLPQPISYNGSFVFWSPDSLNSDFVIWVHFDRDNDPDPEVFLPTLFENVSLKETVEDPYFRENGTRIYLCHGPNESTRERYRSRIGELKSDFYRP